MTQNHIYPPIYTCITRYLFVHFEPRCASFALSRGQLYLDFAYRLNVVNICAMLFEHPSSVEVLQSGHNFLTDDRTERQTCRHPRQKQCIPYIDNNVNNNNRNTLTKLLIIMLPMLVVIVVVVMMMILLQLLPLLIIIGFY